MMQRQIMFKQLQELQRQQQLQELGDARQQNYINHLPAINKQASGGQFPPLINGTPLQHTSQLFVSGNMNLLQHGTSPVVQEFTNGLVFSQDQSQALRSMGLVSQQLDVYPISGAGNNLNQYSHLQGASHDFGNVFAKGNNNQVDKPAMQSLVLSNSFMNDQCIVSSDQVFHEKNLFGQVPLQGVNSGILSGNLHQKNVSAQDFGGRQEQAGWPGLFPGKTTNMGLSQGLASLDPLEQKILFNTDENSWEASFGKHNNMGTGGLDNTMENTGCLSAFSSIQSGSWSALMQSAVAEASSSDSRVQEEWSGFSFQNPERSTGNQPANFVDSRKQEPNWVDNNLQSASSLSSKPGLSFNDSNMSSSFPGFQQLGIQASTKKRDGMCTDSDHESIQQSPKISMKWLDFNPQQKQPIEGSQPVQTLPFLQNAWPGQAYEQSESIAHQLTMSLNTNGSQACNNLTGGVNRAVNKDSDSLWKSDNQHGAGSFSVSVGRLEQVTSGKVNTVVDREDSSLNNFFAVPKSSATNIDQTVDHETRVSGQYYFQRENSSDSHHSNASQRTVTRHELRENVWPHGSNSRFVSGGNQKPSDQVGQNSFTFRGVPYHPMGNLGVNTEHADNMKHVTHSQFLFHKVPQGFSPHEQGQFKIIGNVSNSSMGLEKDCLPDMQRNSETSDELSCGSNVGSISPFFEGPTGFHGTNIISQTSRNMLDLLNKVDKSSEHGTGMHFGSLESTPVSEMSQAETSIASVVQSNNKSSASQYFGLRLAPPPQRLSTSNCFDSSQSSPQTGNSIAAFPLAASHIRSQLQNQNLPAAHVACQSPEVTLPGVASRFSDFNLAISQDTSRLIRTDPYRRQFPILDNVPASQQSVMSGSQVEFLVKPSNVWTNVPTQRYLSSTEPPKVPSSLLPSPDSVNSSLETASGAPWEQQHQNFLKGRNNLREIGARSVNSQAFDHWKEPPGRERTHLQISLDPVSQTGRLSHGQESAERRLFEANSVASGSLMTNSHQQGLDISQHRDNQALATSARDLEAYGCSLKSSNVLHQNNSQLHQVHSVNKLENEPSKSISAGNLANHELNAVSQLNSFPSGSNKILSFSSEARGDQSGKTSPLVFLRDTSEEMLKFGNNSNMESDGIENPQISLQMASSWFKHHGTLKNEQMLPMYDIRAAKNAAEQFSLRNPFENFQMKSFMMQVNSANASHVSNVCSTSASASVAVQRLSPPHVLPSDVTGQNSAVLRTKKRKIAAFELLPWHKEVTQASRRLQTSSEAELKWAQATNRLIEKVEGEGEMIEDGLPMVRPKKRLILTTHLMQQLFWPAAAAILSADATSNCDIMIYSSARLALGDACSMSSDCQKPCDTCDMSSEKLKTSEALGDQDFLKIVADFISRTKRLEEDLLRLDKGSSILDIRVESQELEKFSIINHFAKFHSRGQAGTADTSSSSGTAPTIPKPSPQRYVTAFPMPRDLPEGARCLSL